jgi:hypothetical protein
MKKEYKKSMPESRKRINANRYKEYRDENIDSLLARIMMIRILDLVYSRERPDLMDDNGFALYNVVDNETRKIIRDKYSKGAVKRRFREEVERVSDFNPSEDDMNRFVKELIDDIFRRGEGL